MKFCPVVPEICRGQVHGARKERIIIIIIIIRNGAKTISLQTLCGEKNPLTSSIAIIDAAVIVVRGCLLQLIVCRGFYFVGEGGYYKYHTSTQHLYLYNKCHFIKNYERLYKFQ
jgi:hypothetical protein